MFDKIFFLPKVKQSTIINNKYGVYELPHELPNDLRLSKCVFAKENVKNYKEIAKKLN